MEVAIDRSMASGRRTRARRRRGPCRAYRWLTLLAAVVTLTGLLTQVGHMTIVTHTLCANHGRMVHASDAQAAHAVDGGDGADVALESGADHDDDHDHCDAIATDERAIAAAPTPEPRVLGGWSSGLAPPAATERFARRLYLLAPKTSPPA